MVFEVTWEARGPGARRIREKPPVRWCNWSMVIKKKMPLEAFFVPQKSMTRVMATSTGGEKVTARVRSIAVKIRKVGGLKSARKPRTSSRCKGPG